ncbi:DUF5723 family protein [Costertonia aggregata]|uniref:DUF5723 domain-containing protein n=1 Tax=Costertonia aggregata TaxID=343403 RepID=A0A7H9ARF2_9FLAO|nr:DUF5723 family protein [Costertonia aggregata]QLG46071.1 hypothetical protein HYG79_12180 [Costertonia aggregata]
MRICKGFFLFILFFGCYVAGAQNKQLLYDFNEIPQALMLNPGMETDFDWFAGMPLLSGTSFQFGSSGVSVDDIFADDGLDINDKIRERVLGQMGINDELSGTYQIELLTGGFRGKKNTRNFYTFGVYHEGDAIGYWFKDLAFLAFEGNADQLGKRFDLSHLKARGEMLNVFHFGVNKQMGRNLTVGVRGKIYSGIFNFQSTKNEGYFVTDQGQNNLLANILVANMRLRTSGINAIENTLDNETVVGEVIKRGFFGGDLGVGVDLGFTYRLNEQTYITGSLLDLGFLYHTNDIKSFTLQGNATVEGIELILPQDAVNSNRDFWQDLVDEVEALIPFEENNDAYISLRPTKLYASLRYDFGKNLETRINCDCSYLYSSRDVRKRYTNSMGGQIYIVNRPRGPQTAVTAFYQRRFGNGLSLKTTYTADKFSFTNIGLGINLQAGPVNLYAMADNLLAYQNIAASRYASFQLGVNIISWGRK